MAARGARDRARGDGDGGAKGSAGHSNGPSNGNGNANSNNNLCTNGVRRRRAQRKPSPTPAAKKADVISIGRGDDDEDCGGLAANGIFGSHRMRLLISMLAAVLVTLALLTSPSDSGGGGGPEKLKDLSDKVVELSRQIHYAGFIPRGNSEDTKRESDLERKLREKDIELAWERQHVAEERQTKEMMRDDLLKQIVKEEATIKGRTNMMNEMGTELGGTRKLLEKEKEENANLKVALAFALEELAKERAKLPPAPGAGRVKAKELGHGSGRHNANNRHSRLRNGGRYQPGDNVEIIEYEEGGKVVLRPGIVSDVNADTTYNVVKLETSVLQTGLRQSQFQTYHVYPRNHPAFIEISREVYIPITILQYLPGSGRAGLELHGRYEFYFDDEEYEALDDRGGRKLGTRDGRQVREGQAMRIHRYAAVGEIVGFDPSE